MTSITHRARHRLAIVVFLTLLPWPAVWLGMYKFDNLILTFLLYHGVCLLPASLWGYSLWRPALRWPSRKQWLILLTAVVCLLPASLVIYGLLGARIMSAADIDSVVTARGFKSAWLLPLGLYFVPVNAILEELFWRGVVLNELRGTGGTIWRLGAVWTAVTFAAWHYLVLRLLLRPGWAEATVLVIVAVGVFLAWLYRRTHSIILPILWHGLIFDLILIVVFGAVVRTR